jgi:hypothetical protein
MKTNTKVRLLVAALGGNVFFYNDARASSTGYSFGESTPGEPLCIEKFGFGESEELKLTPYGGFIPIPPKNKLSRRPTIKGILGHLRDGILLSTDQREQGMARMLSFLLQKHCNDILPAFISLTVEEFEQVLEEGGIDECSLEESFAFSVMNPKIIELIVRSQHSLRKAIAVYGYAAGSIMGPNGVVNRMKGNIMDEALMIIQLTITPNIPPEVVSQLERYVDHLIGQIVPALKQATFEILQSDMAAEVATGCCGSCKKLKKKDKENLANGICHMLGGVLGRFFGEGFERGANELAQGICGIINARSDS